MVTGIETAGLVLGAFPLVIEGMKVYANGARTMKNMMEYERVLKQYRREISMEQGHFEDMCYNLLEDMTEPEDSILHEMMTDPRHEKWREELHNALSLRLRRPDSFIDAIKEFQTILDDLAITFSLDGGKVSTPFSRATVRILIRCI